MQARHQGSRLTTGANQERTAPQHPDSLPAELEQAAPTWWHFLLPLAALILDIAFATSGASSQTVWHVIRATGVIAYVLLTLSVVVGLLISNRLLPAGRIRGDFFEAHSFMTLLVLAFASFHALALLVDSCVGFRLRRCSYRSHRRTVPRP